MRLSATLQPEVISNAWALRALALSRVMMIGGFGLFFEPAGLPRGRFSVSLVSDDVDFGTSPAIWDNFCLIGDVVTRMGLYKGWKLGLV